MSGTRMASREETARSPIKQLSKATEEEEESALESRK